MKNTVPSPQDDRRINDRAWIANAVAEHEGSLVRYSQHLLGDLDRARDVVQYAYLKLLQSDRNKVEQQLKAWLFRVCRNRAFDILRKESRMRSTETEILDQTLNDRPSPSELVEQQDTKHHIDTLIDDLTEQQREVVRLKFQHALKYKEIAAVTGLTVTNVGFILHTAIQKIRDRAKTEFGLGT